MTELNDRLIKSISTSLIDINIKSDSKLQPKFIYNDYSSGVNLLTSLERELCTCCEFYFAVAFITQSGLIVLKNLLAEMEARNIRGCILTTDYLCFTQPKALKELMQFKNLQVRIYSQENFHVKGYIFKHEEYYSLIIGSGNLTQNALKVNKEWNMKFSSLDGGALAQAVLHEFSFMWESATVLDSVWLSNYAKVYQKMHLLRRDTALVSPQKSFKPNKMQLEALASLEKLRNDKQRKALLISATGTGKTYLSAFAVKQAKAKKVLFLAHREQILNQAATTFQQVLPNISVGFLTGEIKNFSAPYLFSTVTMMAKENIYQRFAPTYFDYIIIDETHRAGAKSYRRILDYFKPQFLLGMTATPERTDGFDIYQLFGYNIAYEIRLQQAMEEDLLCPFHYFGITDITINQQEIDDYTSFNDLTADVRVDYIIEKAQFYGYSGQRVKGLIFCSKIEEAQALSKKFNAKGFYTMALCGRDSQEMREIALARLEQDERINGLDYIFTVDIMNEGIDVPAINQIIMLRPTQSAIVFVQQLGRGLRKFKDKEYVVILDFIGNYQNNFMIPIALSGDISYNKDNIRRYVAEGSKALPGASTISFDEISRQKIYTAIDSAKLSETAFLKTAYLELKQKLGKIPKIEDFAKFGSIDILKYIDKFGSYHYFLQKYEKEYTISFSPAQEEVLSFICLRFARGKRVQELLVLKHLITNSRDFNIKELLQSYQKEYPQFCNITAIQQQSIINNLTNEFTISNERSKYQHCVFIQDATESIKTNKIFAIYPEFLKMISDLQFKQILLEIIDFALNRYHKYYSNRYMQTDFTLYQKYTYEEVCYLLNWQHKINPNAMAGYFYEKITHTMPVFINYINPEEKRVDYTNEFLSDDLITAYSKANRKLDSTDAKHIYNAEQEQNKLYLFVRKPNNDKEAKEFYFLGEIQAQGEPEYVAKYNGFKVLYKLKTPVRNDIFDYFMH